MPGGIERGNLHTKLRARLPGDPYRAPGSHAVRPAARTVHGYRQNCCTDLILLLAQVVFNTNGRFTGPSVFTFTCDTIRSEYFLTANGQTLTRGIPNYGDV